MILEALSLNKDKGAIALVKLSLEGVSQDETWPCELNPQIRISWCNLNTFLLEVEMVNSYSMLRHIGDNDLGFTKVDQHCQRSQHLERALVDVREHPRSTQWCF
jgi:hypothetical protein